MVFSSTTFIFIFLPLALIIYLLFNRLDKNKIALIIFSVLFYLFAGTNSFYVMIALLLVNYIIGVLLTRVKAQKVVLAAGIILDIGLLFYFKYINFGIYIINTAFNTSISGLEVIMPLGVSFFIFSMISYLMDIYRGEDNCSFVDFLWYILFFPKIISGPIMAYKDFLKSKISLRFSTENLAAGIERFIIGLAKKVIIADVLGSTVDTIFNSFAIGIDTPTAWIGAICYTMQIYFDFSGYSDMAIGIARMFGFTLNENFAFPYVSQSISEFWRRWHISLGSWFRNYLYIPLGGNRRGNVYVNLFIVFLATGIWHGASFTFIFWGIGIGIIMIIERLIMKKEWYRKIPSVVKWFVTFNLLNLSWVIFKSEGIHFALQYYGRMFGVLAPAEVQFTWQHFAQKSIIVTLMIAFVGSTLLNNSRIQKIMNETANRSLKLYAVKVVVLLAMFILAVIYMVSSSYSPFIYFQF